jgi:hypothetical protein
MTPLLPAFLLAVSVAACAARGRILVEQRDNGPVNADAKTARSPAGHSEGYLWVEPGALPPPGKNWTPVDPAGLTAAQRARIRR